MFTVINDLLLVFENCFTVLFEQTKLRKVKITLQEFDRESNSEQFLNTEIKYEI